MLKILSLGAGVQSSTILLMSCYGELEKPASKIAEPTRPTGATWPAFSLP